MSQKLKTLKKPKVRILAAVPAIHTDHIVYLEQVKQAVFKNIEANPDFEVNLLSMNLQTIRFEKKTVGALSLTNSMYYPSE